ncbi:MAG: T9SS type A sorting domain-containing protein, partial [Bacteroidota bacterium]|nr:T9SS type A sorting domain-containing protein [Bacteroidota bacterium]
IKTKMNYKPKNLNVMKKIYTFLFAIIFAFSLTAQDLTINQFNLGYNYDPATGIISDMYFYVMNIDDNEDVAWSFYVAILLSDPDDPYTIYEADRYEIDGLSASSSMFLSDWNIDLNSVSDLPSGDYCLGIFVDVDDDISETDEDNNYYYISPEGYDLTFNGGAGIYDVTKTNATLNQNYPNPVINKTEISFDLETNGLVNISVYDMTGKLIKNILNKNLSVGTYKYSFDLSSLHKSMYFYRLKIDNNTIQTKKLIKY